MSITNIEFRDIEFAQSDLNCIEYNSCSFSHVKFENKRFKNCKFYNCQFLNCTFISALIGVYKKGASGSFENCVFTKCSFQYALICSTLIKETTFQNCNFTNASFEGTQLVNIKFTGKVNFCSFYYLPMHRGNNLFFYFENRFVQRNPNKMENVDFSGAQLFNVSFVNGVRFEKIKFGINEYVLLPNEENILKNVFEDIKKLDFPEEIILKEINVIQQIAALPQNKKQKLLYFGKSDNLVKKDQVLFDLVYKILEKYTK